MVAFSGDLMGSLSSGALKVHFSKTQFLVARAKLSGTRQLMKRQFWMLLVRLGDWLPLRKAS